MSSTVKKISPVVNELAITIPADEIDKSATKMFKRVQKTAKVKGFRQGKIPFQIAKKMFSSSVYAELTSELTYRFFLESLKEHELSPVGEPEFLDISSVVKGGEDYSFKVKVETAPKLESINTDDIVLKKPKVKLDKDLVKKELKRLQGSLATTKDFARKRALKVGDWVKVELRRKEDNGEWSEKPLPQELVLEEEQAPKEILESLPGMKLEEEKEITFGADGDNPTTFLTKLVEHKQRVLPKLDDDFAKDLGEFETLKELKADIEKKFVEMQEKRIKDNLKSDLIEALREKNPMDLPPSILQKQADTMRNQYQNILSQVDKNIDGEKEGDEKSEDKIDETTQTAASNILHTHFLIDEIARIGELKIEEEDIEAQFQEMAKSTGMPVARLKAEYQDRKYAAELESRILEDKVFDFLSPKVKIEEVEPETKETNKDDSK